MDVVQKKSTAIDRYRYREERPERSVRDEIAELKDIIVNKEMREDTKKKQKPFKWPGKFTGIAKRSLKKDDRVLVVFLNKFGKIEAPKLLPVQEGDMVIIKDIPYEFNPQAIWRMNKFNVVLIKEIDRRPVSNLDYDEIKKRGDCTDSDVFLIKAAMRAFQKEVKKEMSKAILWVIIAIIVGLVIFFFLKK
jgi:hypothetical protein